MSYSIRYTDKPLNRACDNLLMDFRWSSAGSSSSYAVAVAYVASLVSVMDTGHYSIAPVLPGSRAGGRRAWKKWHDASERTLLD